MNELEKRLQPYLNTRNFFNYKDFYKHIAAQGYKTLAEVGSWKGHSIGFLANQMIKNGNRSFELYAVDIWEDCQWKNLDKNKDIELKYIYEIFQINLRKQGVLDKIRIVKENSDKAASRFADEYFDFVYIDADHHYESVLKDIKAWYPKVKNGGIIAGHDYYNKADMKAKEAVDKLVQEKYLPKIKEAKGSVWYSVKK